jgi:ubiquinone/menaquinone biosynthesis C-methylase UbiE
MPKKEDQIAKTIQTYEEIADDYCQVLNDINIIKNHADYFLENIPGKKLLDVGCGPGRDAKYFSEHGMEVVGIDLTANFIKLAIVNVPKAIFKQMDMRKLDFANESFDGIWSCASFLHIPKKEAKDTLLNLNRVLKPGGLIFVSVKHGMGEKMVGEKHYQGGEKFFAFYTQQELVDLFTSCGFDIQQANTEHKGHDWVNVFAKKGKR